MAGRRRPHYQPEQIGDLRFQRFVVSRSLGSLCCPKFYTGRARNPWTRDRRRALVYADRKAAEELAEKLTQESLGSTSRSVYRLEIAVNVLGEATERRVREYLDRHLLLLLDRPDRDDGSGPPIHVIVSPDLESLRLVERSEPEKGPGLLF